MDANREKGILGETLALEYLVSQGYIMLDKNYRAQGCEVDIIMREGDMIVFVEVKARHASRFGTGREAVTKAKQRNIIKAATNYLVQHDLMEEYTRFDVAEVDLDTKRVELIKNAFML